MLKLTTDKHEASRGLSATAELLVVSPGNAPAIITQYVAWMERQFNACQTPRSMYTYLSSIVSELLWPANSIWQAIIVTMRKRGSAP